ncbi:MAG: hypothetical protein N2484_00620 [Clostridia bacterium]|nr:hypothetical protein [Clostridia bacterium]
MNKCKHCGGDKLIKDLHVKRSNEIGFYGIPYTKSIFVGTEPFRIELCQECGTINRLYVKDMNRNWVKDDPK